MTKKKPAAKDVQVALRLPASLLERADSLVEPMKDDPEYELWRVSRAAVLRVALQKGLAVMERGYRLKKA